MKQYHAIVDHLQNSTQLNIVI